MMATEEDIIKQIIVVRKDLMDGKTMSIPCAKMAVQIAHASMAVILDQMTGLDDGRYLDLKHFIHTNEWLESSFRKIVLYVKSEEALMKKFTELKEAGIEVSLITDAGYTIFDKPTITCFGVQPLPASVIDPHTKRLRLLT